MRYLAWANRALFAEPDWHRLPIVNNETSALVGIATGYDAAQLRPLVETYRRCCDGAIVLATDSPEGLRRLADEFNVGIAFVRSRKELPVDVMIGRFALLHAIVRSLHSNIEQVVLSDTRDAWFQGDPLKSLDSDAIHFFSEGNNPALGGSATGRWLARLLGRSAVEPIAHEMMINAGVVVGPRASIERYLHIVAMLAAIPRGRLLRLKAFSVDQPLANYVAHHRLLADKSTLHRNLDVVANLYGVDNERITLRGGTVYVAEDSGERCPAVVHMWDRSAKLRALARDKWGIQLKESRKSALHYPRRWIRSLEKRIPELR
jgi:hypothetical protein